MSTLLRFGRGAADGPQAPDPVPAVPSEGTYDVWAIDDSGEAAELVESCDDSTHANRVMHRTDGYAALARGGVMLRAKGSVPVKAVGILRRAIEAAWRARTAPVAVAEAPVEQPAQKASKAPKRKRVPRAAEVVEELREALGPEGREAVELPPPEVDQAPAAPPCSAGEVGDVTFGRELADDETLSGSQLLDESGALVHALAHGGPLVAPADVEPPAEEAPSGEHPAAEPSPSQSATEPPAPARASKRSPRKRAPSQSAKVEVGTALCSDLTRLAACVEAAGGIDALEGLVALYQRAQRGEAF